ncbi:MAG: type IX secretion system membrane protein PorP/SprF [Flavobacteriaceae bacterium]|nr:type IX secretion system membrane protein PorP/SprF [Flavobacteriaceae bacterium]
MKIYTYIIVILIYGNLFSQETLPIYFDYLSDNIYLIHPSAAGIGNCGKIRLTINKQWLNVKDSPSLQTVSYHSKISPKTGFGAVLFNDENGYHSQKGMSGTFAYHLDLGSKEFKQLSLAASAEILQSTVDQTQFLDLKDDFIEGITDSQTYFNSDLSIAYHIGVKFYYFTIKNAITHSIKDINTKSEFKNRRKYILTIGKFYKKGYFFDYELSTTSIIEESLKNNIVDLNIKLYKSLDDYHFWFAGSLRNKFGGDIIGKPNQVSYIFGFNYGLMSIAYTYTKLSNSKLDQNGSFHQITLGLNVFCETYRGSQACPNISSF